MGPKGLVRLFARVLICSLLIGVSGCYFASHEDVTTDPLYSAVVNKHYRATAKTIIHGVTMDRNYAKVLDHYSVMVVPGFGGREVLSKDELPPGTEFQVLKVMVCTDCYLDFGERVHLVVKVTSSAAYDAAPVNVPYEYVMDSPPVFVEIPRETDKRS